MGKSKRRTSFENIVCVQMVCDGDVVWTPEREVHAAGALGHHSEAFRSVAGYLLRGEHRVILPRHYRLLPGNHADEIREHVLVGYRVGVGDRAVFHLTDSCHIQAPSRNIRVDARTGLRAR